VKDGKLAVQLCLCSNMEQKRSFSRMDLSIKNVPEKQVARLRARAKANHRSLQGELRALIEQATGATPRRLSIDEIAVKVSKLGLTRRNEAVRLIREDRDR
jgi:plasmid stability protein